MKVSEYIKVKEDSYGEAGEEYYGMNVQNCATGEVMTLGLAIEDLHTKQGWDYNRIGDWVSRLTHDREIVL